MLKIGGNRCQHACDRKSCGFRHRRICIRSGLQRSMHRSQRGECPSEDARRDNLYADVYRPTEAGTYPVLLIRLPYNKAFAQSFVYGPPEWYAAQCYIVVSQDVRGQFASQGAFYPFRNEMNDGYDSVEWAAQLPGSSGKVGMYGFSYVGATQWLAATQAPPHLTAIVPASHLVGLLRWLVLRGRSILARIRGIPAAV